MIHFGFSHLCDIINLIIIAWSYADTIASVLYKLAAFFKKFSFIDILQEDNTCTCIIASRFIKFCDPQTLLESSSFSKVALHIQTMDTGIVQYKQLKQVISQGLNHIPL
jgi:hypothetical protein